MSKRSATHATFVIERDYSALPERVFHAWSEPAAKRQWFVGPDEWQSSVQRSNHKLDFRVGGSESVSGGPKGGSVHHYNAIYQDIVPNQRIVLSYDMRFDDKRISVSLATVEFKPASGGTKLIYTEQGVYLDGYDDAGSRERGTRDLLDNLEAALHRKAGAA